MLSKQRLSNALLLIFTVFFLGISQTSFANDDTESSTEKSNDSGEFEWQIVLELSLVYDPKIIAGIKQEEPWHYMHPAIWVDLSYKGFFLQSNQRRASLALDGFELGYHIQEEEDWQLDVIIKSYMEGFDSESLIEYGGGNDSELKGLSERDSIGGIALRYSYYLDNALLTLDIASAHAGNDEHGDHVQGFIFDSFYSHLVQHRNWDIYLGAGFTYYSQDIMDYYIGVSFGETNENRPEFTAEEGYRAQAEIYAQHPISTNWSFNTGITHSYFSSNVKDSPIVDENQVTQVMVGVLYVF